MAESPSHRFGQIIGDLLEAAVYGPLAEFSNKHSLFLDRKGPRPARSGAKCTWIDAEGNKHDLDFVLEKNGRPTRVGDPVAFIETAWRRYTKHSKNKAQEIQGALLPLAKKYADHAPFLGTVLAGVFTEGALAQLRSNGFTVLYFPYETTVRAFAAFGIDAAFDENTPDVAFAKKVAAFEALSGKQREALGKALLVENDSEVIAFIAALRRAVVRAVTSVRILPLHGLPKDHTTVKDAITFIEGYSEEGTGAALTRYEVRIKYSNGDVIEGAFEKKADAIAFLKGYSSSAA